MKIRTTATTDIKVTLLFELERTRTDVVQGVGRYGLFSLRPPGNILIEFWREKKKRKSNIVPSQKYGQWAISFFFFDLETDRLCARRQKLWTLFLESTGKHRYRNLGEKKRKYYTIPSQRYGQ